MMIKRFLFSSLLMAVCTSAVWGENTRDRLFDSDWRFLRGDAARAEQPSFDDSGWRTLDVPHDWSIEDLPADEDQSDRIGPFDPEETQNKHFTGNTVGGVGWYRKHFTLDESGKQVAVRFDGVYMNCEVWINGHRLGEHPHGYTAFEFDLTPYLKKAGEENVLAVKVRNEGRNSRWYSGSGIYRHVWLTVRSPVHVPTWGVFVTTPEVSRNKALVKISSEIANTSSRSLSVGVLVRVLDSNGKLVDKAGSKLQLPVRATRSIEQSIKVDMPELWSLDSPTLYTAEVEVGYDGESVDKVSVPFGIRKLEFSAHSGFLLNGEPTLLKGGCIHHDNGPLGAAAIDRAEERKVELLKANGYNAIRSAHNPPSSALLDACDRLGMLMIDEAFDQWEESKENNAQDYHGFFGKWFEKDIASMVRRDRNHPSVIMWSIGNEIPEQYRAKSTQKELREAVLSHDSTRPVTQAISTDWGEVVRNWDDLSDPAFKYLDVAGYNYLPQFYVGDHERHPDRVMYCSESFPKDAFDYWKPVEELPYLIGDFVWTAMDYLGEAGLAHSLLSNEQGSFFMPWPWIGAWSGDLDLCGFKKPQSYYRDVLWRLSPIEVMVHEPIPDGLTEELSWWGWPNEMQSWNWQGHEGTPLQVRVFSRCEKVRLELNGKVIGEQPVSEDTKLVATFDVPYEPGELKAYGLKNGKVVAETMLKTSGAPKAVKLTADRTVIRADRSDLSYVTVEIVDENGQRVPDAEQKVRFIVEGAGELAGQTSGSPNKPASFKAPECTTMNGRCIAILRPTGGAGDITMRVEADGLIPASIVVHAE